MKRTLTIIFYCLILLIGVGCASDAHNNDDIKILTDNTNSDDVVTEKDIIMHEDSNDVNIENNPESDPFDKQDKSNLNHYSNEQIEYARIWLQLGPNQQIDSLNVVDIAMGEPLNPDDQTSVSYPEDVIQLSGNRLVDGSITYSSNHDGTINVYNVPLRWDGQYPADERFYNDIINNTEKIAIKKGDDNDVIQIIELIN